MDSGVTSVLVDTASPDSGSGLDTALNDTASWDDTGSDTGADTGADPTDPELAEIGPDLPDQLPRSVLEAGPTEQDLELQIISGSYPEGLKGHIFFVHPLPFEDGSAVLLGSWSAQQD